MSGGRRCVSGLAALLLAACAAGPPRPGPDVAARIAGVDVRYAEFDAHLRRTLGEGAAGLASEALSQLLDQFLTERLLVRTAAERGLVGADADAGRATDALLAQQPREAPTEQEIEAWYQAHRESFRRPERVELAQILTDDRLAAERARREIVAGTDFATVARRVSTDPVAARGGQTGVFAREDLPPAFADIVFRLPEGGVSEVVATDYGFHVFQVRRRLPAAVPELAEVHAEVASRLAAEKADAALARLVAEARSRYAVEVFDRNLPFVYHGVYPVSRPYEKKS
jgi:parvulin-like peptidyl-prolyl isomerase